MILNQMRKRTLISRWSENDGAQNSKAWHPHQRSKGNNAPKTTLQHTEDLMQFSVECTHLVFEIEYFLEELITRFKPVQRRLLCAIYALHQSLTVKVTSNKLVNKNRYRRVSRYKEEFIKVFRKLIVAAKQCHPR